IVVCDDGSTDGSQRILECYHSLDARIKPIYQANGGQSLALNAALRNSTGEIICLLDGDDVFLPEKVELVVKAFAADSCSGFAVNRMRLVDKTRKKTEEHTSELQSRFDLVCRLLLEKKK